MKQLSNRNQILLRKKFKLNPLREEVLKRSKDLSEAKQISPMKKTDAILEIMMIDDDYYNQLWSSHKPPESSADDASRWVKFFIFHRLYREKIVVEDLPEIFGIQWGVSEDEGQYQRYISYPRQLSYLTGHYPIPDWVIKGRHVSKKQFALQIATDLNNICNAIAIRYCVAVEWVPTGQGGFPASRFHHGETHPKNLPEILKNSVWLSYLQSQKEALYKAIEAGATPLREALITRDPKIRFLLSVAAIENASLRFYEIIKGEETRAERACKELQAFDSAYQQIKTESSTIRPTKAKQILREVFYANIGSIKKSVTFVLDTINAMETKKWLYDGEKSAYTIRSNIIHGQWIDWTDDTMSFVDQECVTAPFRAQIYVSALIEYIAQNCAPFGDCKRD